MRKILVLIAALCLLHPTPARTDGSLLTTGSYTLIVTEHHAIREFDPRGQELVSIAHADFENLSGAKPLPNGNILVCNSDHYEVLEVDRKGNISWRHNVGGLTADAHRLPNGRTLIALEVPDKLVEVNREGQVVWSMDTPGRPLSAYPHRNGKVLTSLMDIGKVMELDQDGPVTWEPDLAGKGITAWRIRPLNNHNVLIMDRDHGAIYEMDRSGKIVWEVKDLSAPRDAVRLADGKTLVVEHGKNRVVEISRDGKIRPLIENLNSPYRIEINLFPTRPLKTAPK